LTGFCEFWTRRFEIQTMCITLGEAGCYVYSGGIAYTLLGFPTRVEDTVGAGDAFAAAYLHGLHNGWPIQLTAQFANALGSIVAGKAGAVPPWSIEECFELARISSSPRRIS
jgi:fructokinase